MAKHNSKGKALNERVQTHSDGTKEFWRDIPGYEGLYRVSNWGRVKSLIRTFVKRTRWGGTMKNTIKGRIMYQRRSTKTGRYTIGLVGTENRKQIQYQVHHLVMFAFIGPRPKGMECCHNDGNPSNNRLENLRWDTHVNNKADQILHGTHTRGERNGGGGKLTETKVLRIRKLFFLGYSKRDIAPRFGVTPEMIHRIITRKAWKHV